MVLFFLVVFKDTSLCIQTSINTPCFFGFVQTVKNKQEKKKEKKKERGKRASLFFFFLLGHLRLYCVVLRKQKRKHTCTQITVAIKKKKKAPCLLLDGLYSSSFFFFPLSRPSTNSKDDFFFLLLLFACLLVLIFVVWCPSTTLIEERRKKKGRWTHKYTCMRSDAEMHVDKKEGEGKKQQHNNKKKDTCRAKTGTDGGPFCFRFFLYLIKEIENEETAVVLTEKQVTTTIFSLCPSNLKRKTGVVVEGGGACLCLCVCVFVLVCKRTGIIFCFSFPFGDTVLPWAEEFNSPTVINAATCLTFSAYAHDFLPCTIFLLYLQVCEKREREEKKKKKKQRGSRPHIHIYIVFFFFSFEGSFRKVP